MPLIYDPLQNSSLLGQFGLVRRLFTGSTSITSAIPADLYWESNSGVTGSPVSAWASVVGSLTLSQGSAGSRPSVTASAFGSTQGLTFDGVDDVLVYAGRAVSRTGASSLSIVFKTGTSVVGPFVIVSQSDSAATNDWWEIGITTEGKLYIENNALGVKQTINGSTVLSPSTIYNAILTYDGVDFYLVLNGIEENPLEIINIGSFAWLGRVGGTQNFSVGATVTSGGNVRFFNGSIGAIYFWNQDITG